MSEEKDKWAVKDAGFEDLDAKRVSAYIDKRQSRLGEKTSGSRDKLLRELGILTEVGGKSVPTAAGVLLFGKHPQNFLMSSGVRAVRFKGKTVTSDIIDQKEIKGTISEMIDAAVEFAKGYIDEDTDEAFPQGEKFSKYPVAAVKEAITNAIVHRDYTLEGASVRILIFDNRIEVYTPGGLPEGVTAENLEYTQYSRNEIIAETLLDLGEYIVKLGTGIKRIKSLVKEWGLKEPEFLDTGVDFLITIFGPIDRDWRVKKQERVLRIEKSLGPTKTPQEIGYLSRDKYAAHRQVHKSHRRKDAPKDSRRQFKINRKIIAISAAVIILFTLAAGAFNHLRRSRNPFYRYQKAALWHQRQSYHKAIKAYVAFIKKFPQHSKTDDARYYLAACFEKIGRDQDALKAYKKLIDNHPHSPWREYAYYWRGSIYHRLGKFDDAIIEYQKVLADGQENPLGLSALEDTALIYQKQDKFREALSAYRKILESKESLSDGYEHYQIALCYLNLGEFKEARINFEKVIANKQAKEELIGKAEKRIAELDFPKE